MLENSGKQRMRNDTYSLYLVNYLYCYLVYFKLGELPVHKEIEVIVPYGASWICQDYSGQWKFYSDEPYPQLEHFKWTIALFG